MALDLQDIQRELLAAGAQRRQERVSRWLWVGNVWVLTALSVGIAMDARLHFGAPGRWVCFAGIVLPRLAAGWAARRWARQPLDEQTTLRWLEEGNPQLGTVLRGALQFKRDLPSRSPLQAAMYEEMPDVRALLPAAKRRFTLGSSLGWVVFSVAAAGWLILWGMLSPGGIVRPASRLLVPWAKLLPSAGFTVESIVPRNAAVPFGSALEISAQTTGRERPAVFIRWREAGGAWRRDVMTGVPGGRKFVFRVGRVEGPLTYALEAGGIEWGEWTVDVQPPVAVRTRRVEIEPPSYLGLPRRTVEKAGPLEAVPEGTRVTLGLEFSGPVESLLPLGDSAGGLRLQRLDARRWSAQGVVQVTQKWTFSFHGGDGTEGRVEFAVEAVPDRAPLVEAATETIAAGRVRCRIVAADDHGLDNVGLYVSSEERPEGEAVREWHAVVKRVFEEQVEVDLRRYARPGASVVTLRVAARDQREPDPRTITFRVLSVPLGPGVAPPARVASTPAPPAFDPASLGGPVGELATLQATNLRGTRAAAAIAARAPTGLLRTLLDRQVAVGNMAGALDRSPEGVPPDARLALAQLVRSEMPAVALALSTAVAAAPSSPARADGLREAVRLQLEIIARLAGAPLPAIPPPSPDATTAAAPPPDPGANWLAVRAAEAPPAYQERVAAYYRALAADGR